MHFILRDWNRLWFLAGSADARRVPGAPVDTARSAYFILARLLQNPANLTAARDLERTTYPRGPRPVPGDYRGLLAELQRALERHELVLLRGALYDLRTGSGANPDKASPAAKEVWDFFPDGDPAATPVSDPDDSVPALRFSAQGDDPFPFTFVHGSEKHPGLDFAHVSEGGPALGLSHGSEEGPALAFAHAAEGGTPGLGHSSVIHPSL